MNDDKNCAILFLKLHLGVNEGYLMTCCSHSNSSCIHFHSPAPAHASMQINI